MMTKAEGKALMGAVHMARLDKRISDEDCKRLCDVVERELYPSEAFGLAAFKQGFWASGEGYNGEYTKPGLDVEPGLEAKFGEWFRLTKYPI